MNPLNQPRTGWTPTETVKPADKASLIALRDLLLEWKDTNAAAAVDNVIDILSLKAGSQPVEKSRSQMLIEAGVVNSDGSLKPYKATGHKSEPLPAFEDLYGDDLVF